MVGAVVLAAGMSTRMGQPKQLLPWGSTVIVRHVVDTLAACGVAPIVAVTGAAHSAVEAALLGSAAQVALNPDFVEGDMLSSLQTGLTALIATPAQAALVALGDQPQLQPTVVQAVLARWLAEAAPIVAPSYRRRRGHPILFARSLWPELLQTTGRTPREFLQAHHDQIAYAAVDTDSVLRDVDTPEDYRRERDRAIAGDI